MPRWARRGTSKYGNKRVGGYDSKRELTRAGELVLELRANRIANLREQVPFLLIPKQDGEQAVHYVADFVYYRDGKTIVEDAKGVRTAEYIIKRKLMLYVLGIRITEV